MNKNDDVSKSLVRLKEIVAKLRDPNGGCPWDLEQTHQTLRPYVIEEAYEVVDSIDNDIEKLPDELGDLLLQVMIHSQIGEESGTFSLKEVIDRIADKMVRRHPHVFGDIKVKDSEDVLKNWEMIKRKEQGRKEYALDSIPRSLPALLKAQRIGDKASRLGFDWPSVEEVKLKVKEELTEFLNSKTEPESAEEIGDLFFAMVQLCRLLKLNAEETADSACRKFIKRFNKLEDLTELDLKKLSLVELEELWQKAKHSVG